MFASIILKQKIGTLKSFGKSKDSDFSNPTIAITKKKLKRRKIFWIIHYRGCSPAANIRSHCRCECELEVFRVENIPGNPLILRYTVKKNIQRGSILYSNHQLMGIPKGRIQLCRM
jgi:hypothetical protein